VAGLNENHRMKKLKLLKVDVLKQKTPAFDLKFLIRSPNSAFGYLIKYRHSSALLLHELLS
jgi:hypothetical protein